MAGGAIRLQKKSTRGSLLSRQWGAPFLAAVLSLVFVLFRPPAAEGGPWAPIIDAAAGTGGVLYVLTSEKGGLFVSEDGGRRWKNPRPSVRP